VLNETERQQIEHEARAYPDRQALSIEALRIVQRQRGWISDETLRDIAAYLAISPDALEGVATFYNLIHRRPVGRHVIRLCDSVSCWLCGYEAIRDGLRQKLNIDFGGTTADGRYTLLPNACLGRCEYAPVMLIDDDAHDALAADGLDAILKRYP
jgi:NADH-quinone oxidoreductase subunit E